MRIRVSRRARSDLDEIWLYVAERDDIERAQKLIESITAKFVLIGSSPAMGRTRNDLKLGLRSFPEGSFRIYYERTHDGVRIVRVIHAARDEKRQFR